MRYTTVLLVATLALAIGCSPSIEIQTPEASTLDGPPPVQPWAPQGSDDGLAVQPRDEIPWYGSPDVAEPWTWLSTPEDMEAGSSSLAVVYGSWAEQEDLRTSWLSDAPQETTGHALRLVNASAFPVDLYLGGTIPDAGLLGMPPGEVWPAQGGWSTHADVGTVDVVIAAYLAGDVYGSDDPLDVEDLHATEGEATTAALVGGEDGCSWILIGDGLDGGDGAALRVVLGVVDAEMIEAGAVGAEPPLLYEEPLGVVDGVGALDPTEIHPGRIRIGLR